MNQLFLNIEQAGNHLAQIYNLNAGVFVLIYILSIIPIYLGAFLIMYGSTRHLKWRDVFSLKIKSGFHFGVQAKLGLILHIFGWAMPYLYIFFWGKHISIWVYILLTIFFVFSMYFLRKKIISHKNKIHMHGVEVVKKEHINNQNEAEDLWDIYNKTFEPVNEISPCRQSLDKNHFIEVLNDLTVQKYILNKTNYGSIGIALVTNDFKNTPWISADYFRVKFPQEYADKLVYYFMGLAIRNEFRGNKYSMLLIEQIIDDLPHNAVMGFDHSRNINPMLHHFTKIVRQAKDIMRIHVDRQHYHVVQYKK